MILRKCRYASSRYRQQILEWRGIQYGRITQDGELAESLNLSAAEYPALTQRKGRKTVAGYTAPSAAGARDKLIVVDGTTLYYDGQAVGTVTAGEKQIVTVNSKVCVFPDQVCYDTATGVFGTMALDLTVPAANVTFSTTGISLSADPADGRTLEDLLQVNQAIEITGASIPENNRSFIVRAVSGNTITVDKDSLTAGSSTTQVHIKRNMPDLQYVCEHSNRLWGVDDTTIWASALGDPLTFYNYDGLSTDSYAVSLGTEGRFTGICSYGSNLMIWEENAVHRLMGSEPSEYTIYDNIIPGVQAGCHKSLAVVNDVLYYKGAAGVYAYTGGSPSFCGEAFGTRRFSSAVAGTDGLTYYISMQDTDTGEWGLWTLDTLRGIWMREDGTHALDIFRLGSDLLILSADGKLLICGQDDSEEGRISWQAVLTPFDWSIPERKQYTRMYFQILLDAGSWAKIEVREDDGLWRQVWVHHASSRTDMAIPIAPNRCDQLQVRLTGKGRCLVRQVTREYVMGGKR